MNLTQQEAVENRWLLSDKYSPWQIQGTEVCFDSGKMNFITSLLTERLERVIVVSKFAVVAEVISLVCIFPGEQYYQSERGS